VNTSQLPAPVKGEPHPFQPSPEVPAVLSSAGAETSQITSPDGAAPEASSADRCALCNFARSDQIHTDGDDLVDSPHWG
jgi:hypothetical protein